MFFKNVFNLQKYAINLYAIKWHLLYSNYFTVTLPHMKHCIVYEHGFKIKLDVACFVLSVCSSMFSSMCCLLPCNSSSCLGNRTHKKLLKIAWRDFIIL